MSFQLMILPDFPTIRESDTDESLINNLRCVYNFKQKYSYFKGSVFNLTRTHRKIFQIVIIQTQTTSYKPEQDPDHVGGGTDDLLPPTYHPLQHKSRALTKHTPTSQQFVSQHDSNQSFFQKGSKMNSVGNLQSTWCLAKSARLYIQKSDLFANGCCWVSFCIYTSLFREQNERVVLKCWKDTPSIQVL